MTGNWQKAGPGVLNPEPVIPNWEFTLSNGSALFPFSITESTDANGKATFGPLPSGTYDLDETMPDGTWVNTSGLDDSHRGREGPDSHA